MPSFLSAAEKAEMSQQFDNLHETFGRNVVIYRDPERTDIVTNDDYISAYRDYRQGNNFTFDTVPVTGQFMMRIKWLDAKDEDFIPGIDNPLPGQICRLKMKKDAYEFLNGSQSFYVDNIPCEIVGAPKLHGLFDVKFYTVYVKRREMQ
jgi:hypothetical protein